MTPDFSNFAARLREFIHPVSSVGGDGRSLDSIPGDKDETPHVVSCNFETFALELFALQFAHNAPYRKLCAARSVTPESIAHWKEIPAVPTAAFKDFELTCLAPAERTHVFHSSGTTEQRPSRHFHNAESLAIYEASLWPWFAANCRLPIADCRLLILTPPPTQAPNSSLVHMLDVVRRKLGAPESTFLGRAAADGAWSLDFDTTVAALTPRSTLNPQPSTLLLGTAFTFVHLLDFLGEHQLSFQLPPGSRVMETGGYKGRSRSLPKAELHALITRRLGVPPEEIICEYGMSELGSQAYDVAFDATRNTQHVPRVFQFPPWVRAQIGSPESGREVADGETGLLRVFDLANVFSVLAIQTEDLAVRRGDGFELIGRAQLAEPRGCSLMAV
ncbi:MAG: long-chain fatty acid--CoA ligase [Pedosphaera sp.]|nr:long-chain fatty acid--CoA ligase [Pedosphaera sp.]